MEINKRTFTYPPLRDPYRDIRLLTIVPGGDEEPLRCVLDSGYKLRSSACPEYLALSYMWGPETLKYQITVSGKPYHVHENLWRLLCQLRRSPILHYIWIDAICINQHDILEKNAQVRNMGRVYQRAGKVIAWLGSSADQSDATLKMINELPFWFENSARPADLDINQVRNLGSLCARPYWTRTWIIQEIFLARGEVVVLCGTSRTSMERLQNAVRIAEDNLRMEHMGSSCTFQESEHILAAFTSSLFIKTLRQKGMKLDSLLHYHQNSFCSDPRDKIYALQNLASDGQVPVDYSIALPELYWKVLAHCRSTTVQSLKILQEALRVDKEELWMSAKLSQFAPIRPTTRDGKVVESAGTAALTAVGRIVRSEEVTFHTDHAKADLLSSSAGPTSITIDAGQYVYHLNGASHIGLLVQHTVPPGTRRGYTDRLKSKLSSSKDQISFCVFLSELPADQTRLQQLQLMLHQMNAASNTLTLTEAEYDPSSSPSLCSTHHRGTSLTLGRAAIMGILEYYDHALRAGKEGANLRKYFAGYPDSSTSVRCSDFCPSTLTLTPHDGKELDRGTSPFNSHPGFVEDQKPVVLAIQKLMGSPSRLCSVEVDMIAHRLYIERHEV